MESALQRVTAFLIPLNSADIWPRRSTFFNMSTSWADLHLFWMRFESCFLFGRQLLACTEDVRVFSFISSPRLVYPYLSEGPCIYCFLYFFNLCPVWGSRSLTCLDGVRHFSRMEWIGSLFSEWSLHSFDRPSVPFPSTWMFSWWVLDNTDYVTILMTATVGKQF